MTLTGFARRTEMMNENELNAIKADHLLDVRGLTCPQPLLKTRKAFEFLESGEVLEVHGTCPGSAAEASIRAEENTQTQLYHAYWEYLPRCKTRRH